MRRLIIILSGLLLTAGFSYGQVFEIELIQPDPLKISIGNDTLICAGHSALLGNYPVATGGTQEYMYYWEPSEGLDNSTSPNPIATPSETTKYVLTIIDSNGCELSESIRVEVDLCLGIEDNLLIEELIIYPNPSSGDISINGIPTDLSNVNISLINSIGKEVLTIPVDRGNSSMVLELSKNELPRGIYFIKIIASQGVLIRKVQLI